MVFQEAIQTNYSKNAIDSLAAELAEALDFQPGGSLEQLVDKLGGRIHYQDLDDWRNSSDGSVVVKGKHDFDIYLSNFTGPLRDRFTIAHELGHYILHSKLGEKQIKVGRGKSNRLEWEANWFAAGFLMPAKLFRSECEKNPDRNHLASIFMVSPSAIDVRKKSLGL